MCVYRVPVREATRFVEGKTYINTARTLYPIKIIKRTAKMCLVENIREHITWRMKIRDMGNHEEMTDSSVPKDYRSEYTYSSSMEYTEE